MLFLSIFIIKCELRYKSQVISHICQPYFLLQSDTFIYNCKVITSYSDKLPKNLFVSLLGDPFFSIFT